MVKMHGFWSKMIMCVDCADDDAVSMYQYTNAIACFRLIYIYICKSI